MSVARPLCRAALTLVGAVLVAAPATAGSLRFFGSGQGDIDRVKVPIDQPARPADVGATDFTIEWWMRALPGENAADAVPCDENEGWTRGNILFDRAIHADALDPSAFGELGVSLTGGRVAFGVSQAAPGDATTGNTVCGLADVADGVWHHVAVVREASTGELRIYVDGVLDALGPGPVGDVSYQDGRATSYPDSDPFLVIGAGKDVPGVVVPSYRGWIDEVRLSTVRRYTGPTFTRPAAPFTPDASTGALYHLDEGSGDVVADASGGGSDGERRVGGSPEGPAWAAEGAPFTSRHLALEAVPGLTGLDAPVGIAHAGDGRLFVVLRGGQILLRHGDGTVSTFLDIGAGSAHPRVLAGDERGLLGLAFHPEYLDNRAFFVHYTRLPEGDVVIARYEASATDPSVADPDSEQILLTVAHSAFGNHNGGALAFGPDGHLYAGVGDGGGGGDPLNSGQSLGTLLGKVLRLDVDDAPPYVPATNPFAGLPIWAYGLRNPWRLTFDRATGDLFIADVGQSSREEVDLQRATGDAGENGGRNYGWRRMEGTVCFNPSAGCQTGDLVLPVLEYTHAEGCSITGGYRYRGAAIPSVHGVYVFGDFCAGRIWGGIEAGDGEWSRVELLETGLAISSFGEDAAGELYVADLSGAVYRVVVAPPRLVVTKAGAGAGSVSGTGGITCPPTCQADYAEGAPVSLTALAGPRSAFAGWSGACTGLGACDLTMDGDQAVTATFNPQPALQFSAPSYSVKEGRAVKVVVQRLDTTAGTVTVDYVITGGSATEPPAADADFAAPGGVLAGTLVFTPGQSTRTLTLSTVDDRRPEGFETILLALTNPTGGAVLGPRPTASVTITDNDTAGAIQFSTGAYRVDEGASAAELRVTRSGSADGVEVHWEITGGSAVPGQDFGGPTSGLLAFGADVRSLPLAIPLLRQADTRADGPRTILIELSAPTPPGLATLGARKAATLTITDNDRAGILEFSPSTLSASESLGTATLTVTRTRGSASDVAVTWTITGGTAVLGTDFTTPGDAPFGTLDFGAGVGRGTIPITILPRTGVQGPRTVIVTLSAPTGGALLRGAATATLTITDQ